MVLLMAKLLLFINNLNYNYFIINNLQFFYHSTVASVAFVSFGVLSHCDTPIHFSRVKVKGIHLM
jgi:hypothetical protein